MQGARQGRSGGAERAKTEGQGQGRGGVGQGKGQAAAAAGWGQARGRKGSAPMCVERRAGVLGCSAPSVEGLKRRPPTVGGPMP